MPDQSFDLVVIGGGIVGLSVAMEMTRRFPRLRLLLLEKETKLAQHQTGPQQRCHPLRHLLQTGIDQGAHLCSRCSRDDRVLPEPRHSSPGVREGDRRE